MGVANPARTELGRYEFAVAGSAAEGATVAQDTLEAGMVFALEPRFVLPGEGAVGIETTYVVTEDGVECVTLAPRARRGLIVGALPEPRRR